MEECPNCRKFEFAEYMDLTGIKRCLACGYRERIIYTTDIDRLKRLIKLHEKELLEIEEKERHYV